MTYRFGFLFFQFVQYLAHSGATVNQLLRRAAAAAVRRERNSSHDDLTTLKRQRSDNGLSGNNNSPDVINHMPQVNAADYSTIKHNNNNTLPMKDAERPENYSIESKGFDNDQRSFLCISKMQREKRGKKKPIFIYKNVFFIEFIQM